MWVVHHEALEKLRKEQMEHVLHQKKTLDWIEGGAGMSGPKVEHQGTVVQNWKPHQFYMKMDRVCPNLHVTVTVSKQEHHYF